MDEKDEHHLQDNINRSVSDVLARGIQEVATKLVIPHSLILWAFSLTDFLALAQLPSLSRTLAPFAFVIIVVFFHTEGVGNQTQKVRIKHLKDGIHTRWLLNVHEPYIVENLHDLDHLDPAGGAQGHSYCEGSYDC